ncbi:hypothetical protein D3C80_1707720 [compost metagenome]
MLDPVDLPGKDGKQGRPFPLAHVLQLLDGGGKARKHVSVAHGLRLGVIFRLAKIDEPAQRQ